MVYQKTEGSVEMKDPKSVDIFRGGRLHSPYASVVIDRNGVLHAKSDVTETRHGDVQVTLKVKTVGSGAMTDRQRTAIPPVLDAMTSYALKLTSNEEVMPDMEEFQPGDVLAMYKKPYDTGVVADGGGAFVPVILLGEKPAGMRVKFFAGGHFIRRLVIPAAIGDMRPLPFPLKDPSDNMKHLTLATLCFCDDALMRIPQAKLQSITVDELIHVACATRGPVREYCAQELTRNHACIVLGIMHPKADVDLQIMLLPRLNWDQHQELVLSVFAKVDRMKHGLEAMAAKKFAGNDKLLLVMLKAAGQAGNATFVDSVTAFVKKMRPLARAVLMDNEMPLKLREDLLYAHSNAPSQADIDELALRDGDVLALKALEMASHHVKVEAFTKGKVVTFGRLELFEMIDVLKKATDRSRHTIRKDLLDAAMRMIRDVYNVEQLAGRFAGINSLDLFTLIHEHGRCYPVHEYDPAGVDENFERLERLYADLVAKEDQVS